jgi:predicted nucleotidyltransferase
MISVNEIFSILRTEKDSLRRKGVTDIGLFGSYVRGEATDESDIDILIDLSDDSPMTLFSLTELEQELSLKLKQKVDMVIRRDLKPAIGKRILSEVKYV